MALFGRLFGRRPPKPKPRRPPQPRGGRKGDTLATQPHFGHRGHALGSLAEPDYSAANVARWQTAGAAAVDDFLYGQQPFPVHSSNVAMAVYYHDEEKMMVEFLGGSAYLYSDISEGEALDFARAPSKGVWIWDNLRVRGSATKHRKPYVKLRASILSGRAKHKYQIGRYAPKPGPAAPGA